ncbi:MAG: hypothetical protein PHY40_04340, partial [Patescibacteria group bacterium]|nr:hypothetical protein [Patescibacteria group bacterium]
GTTYTVMSSDAAKIIEWTTKEMPNIKIGRITKQKDLIFAVLFFLITITIINFLCVYYTIFLANDKLQVMKRKYAKNCTKT